MAQVTVKTMKQDESRSIGRHVSKWVEHVLSPAYSKYRDKEVWTPAANLYEDETHYYLVVDLAGVHREKIELAVEERLLTLSGQRPTPQYSRGTGEICLHLMEIEHGRFSRSMEIPNDVDANGISATYRCGFLWVLMPKVS